ncbi:MAG: C45 family peptidase [Solibacillus sp.]
MKTVTSDVLQFRGSHYEFGFWQGEQLKKTPLLQNRTAMHTRLAQKFTADVSKVEQLLQKFAPNLHLEIHGLADSLKLDLQTTYLYFSGYYSVQKSGCSIMMSSDYMIRNYDNAPETYDGRYVLFAPTDGGYATVGPSMQVTGRMDGLNEHGLAMGYNFVNTRGRADGFVCNMIGRILLERCVNVGEAMDLLKEIPHKHSFNYCLLDPHTSRIVEASPRQVTTRTALACTNHFHLLDAENRYRMDDSVAREKAIEHAQRTEATFMQAFNVLNQIDGDVFATKYGAWDGTLHTAAYLPHRLTATIALGGNVKPVPIDFQKWLNGEHLMITKLKGALDAKTGFANS